MSMKGNGVAVADDGRRVSVEYEIREHQERISSSTLDDPGASVPGLKSMDGYLTPECFPDESQFTLEAENGQKYLITGTKWFANRVDFVATPIK